MKVFYSILAVFVLIGIAFAFKISYDKKEARLNVLKEEALQASYDCLKAIKDNNVKDYIRLVDYPTVIDKDVTESIIRDDIWNINVDAKINNMSNEELRKGLRFVTLVKEIAQVPTYGTVRKNGKDVRADFKETKTALIAKPLKNIDLTKNKDIPKQEVINIVYENQKKLKITKPDFVFKKRVYILFEGKDFSLIFTPYYDGDTVKLAARPIIYGSDKIEKGTVLSRRPVIKVESAYDLNNKIYAYDYTASVLTPLKAGETLYCMPNKEDYE